MSSCQLSIIIPFYNTAEYLEDCLSSVISATKSRGIPSEILLVNDMSSDGSADIAERFAAKHPFIRLLNCERESRGPGHARNIGIEQACGDYIAFVDSDDVVVDDIYERMLASLEFHGSDICVCDVSRLKGKKQLFSIAQNRAFSHITLPVTTLEESPGLVFGVFCCNTVIRRSLLEEYRILYPEDKLYEDFLFCLSIAARAEKITFIRNVEYLWRRRDLSNPSITQSYNEELNFLDRLEMNRQALRFAREEIGVPSIIEALQTKVLMLFPATMLSAAGEMTDEELQERIRDMGDFAREYIPEDAYSRIPIIWEQIWRNILSGDPEALRRSVLYQQKNYYSVPVIRRENSYEIVPNPSIITIPRRDLKRDFAFTIPICILQHVSSAGSMLHLSGWIYYRRISMPSMDDQKITAFLYNDITGDRTALPGEPFAADELNEKESGIFNSDDYTIRSYDYTGCGFSFSLDLQDIMENAEPGNYLIQLAYENPLSSGERVLRGMNRNAAVRLSGIHLETEARELTVTVDPRQTLQIRVSEKNEIRRLNERIDALKKEVDALGGENKDLSGQIRDLTASEKTLREKLQTSEDRLRSSRDHWAEEKVSLQGDLAAARKALENTGAALAREKERYAALRGSITFRLGRLIMWLPRKIAGLFR